MKELISKPQESKPHLPGKILINEHEISCKEKIVNQLNTFFTNIGSGLAKKILNTSSPFESYLKKLDTTVSTDFLTINEIKEVFFH